MYRVLFYGLFYGLLMPVMLLLATLHALVSTKTRRSFTLRNGAAARLKMVAAERNQAKPLAWFHVASAGELMQAEPVIKALFHAGSEVLLTFSSPSTEPFLKRVAPFVVATEALPFDLPGVLGRLLRHLKPDVMVYVQAELWPGLVWGAHKQGVPQVLIAARTGWRGNYRAKWGRRGFFQTLYAPLEKILALTAHEKTALNQIVPQHQGVQVGGDPGIDTVVARLEEAAPALSFSGKPLENTPVLVVGSSWPEDAEILVPELQKAGERDPALRIIWAPHEPTAHALRALEALLAPLSVMRLSEWEKTGGADLVPQVLLVDSVGRLASMYRLGSLAYVGGGFSSGVHNVAEPAACGLPVLFGPRYKNSAVAQALLQAEGGYSIETRLELGAVLPALLGKNPAGAKAKEVVEELRGGTAHALAAIHEVAPVIKK